MDPRAEAEEITRGEYEVRVLEPVPPAVGAFPFVRDLLAPGDGDRPVLSPVSSGDVLWDDLAATEPKLRTFCAQRWLGAYPQLPRPPERFAATRDALHLLAEHVVSPTLQRVNGEIALRFARGGFATAFFGNDVQLRVEADLLHVQKGDRVQSQAITSLMDVAEFVGFDLIRTDVVLADAPLDIDPVAARYLGDVYGFAFSVLEELRVHAGAEREPSFVNLWPEHFDVAVELGAEHRGLRAAYGVSPGDADHPEPYIYVGPWAAKPTGELWQAEGFAGAQMTIAELQDADDQRATALQFFTERLEDLGA